MHAPLYNPTKRGKSVKHLDFLVLDDWLITELLKDLRIYDQIPSLKPLRPKMVALCATVAHIRSFRPSGYTDALRDGLKPIISEFYTLLTAEDYRRLRKYLKTRRSLDVENIVLSESPY